jgi:hypothetical protein
MKYTVFSLLLFIAAEALSQAANDDCVIQTALADSEVTKFLPKSVSDERYSVVQARRGGYNTDSAECREHLSLLRRFGRAFPLEATRIKA